MSQILLQPANAMITLENVNKWYGQFHVLKNINLTVQPGERIVLCGPSDIKSSERPSERMAFLLFELTFN